MCMKQFHYQPSRRACLLSIRAAQYRNIFNENNRRDPLSKMTDAGLNIAWLFFTKPIQRVVIPGRNFENLRRCVKGLSDMLERG